MELKKLLAGIEFSETNADLETRINEIRINSTEVGENDIFVCLEGVNNDGNDYLDSIAVPFVAVTEKRPTNAALRYVCLLYTSPSPRDS